MRDGSEMKEHTLAVTVDELKERFSYDPETGEWRYLNPSKFCSIQKGALAGSYRYGHHEIKINGRNYRSNYLVYLYLHGDKIDVNKGKNLFGKMEWTRPVVVEVEIKKTPKQFNEESSLGAGPYTLVHTIRHTKGVPYSLS